jgi:hypothetical protein
MVNYLQQEGGLTVPYIGNGVYNFTEFFKKIPIKFVLNSITLIYRFLDAKYRGKIIQTGGVPEYIKPPEHWHAFISRAFLEENMAYTLDKKCGVHFFVDEEFERNRVSTLKCLEAQRYAGVRSAFEDAHRHLDSQPADTKASVRSTFEAVEILTRLMIPQSKRLNKELVSNLKSIALKGPADGAEANAIGKVFDGFAQWVDGLHFYRHGQGIEKAVAPSLAFAVYAISSGAALLRWLVEIDSNQQR